MALANPRSVGLLTRSTRSRLVRPGYIQATKRYLELSSNGASESTVESLPSSMALGSTKHRNSMRADLAVNDMMEEEEEDAIRPPRAVHLAYLKPLKRTPKYCVPSCNLHLRSYSARNLELFADFALRAAYFLNLPALGPVPLPKRIKRWTVPKSHFIFKKSQENFERITLSRVIQIQDGHPETIQMWLAYLAKRQYYGVGMKANVWTFEKLGTGKDMDANAKDGQSLKDRWEAQFAPQLEPAIQEEVDKWIQQQASKEESFRRPKATSVSPSQTANTPVEELRSGSTDVEAALKEVRPDTQAIESSKTTSTNKVDVSRPEEVLSQAQKIERLLAQIELEATEAQRSGQAAKTEDSEAQAPAIEERLSEKPLDSEDSKATDLFMNALNEATRPEATGRRSTGKRMSKSQMLEKSSAGRTADASMSNAAEAGQSVESKAHQSLLSTDGSSTASAASDGQPIHNTELEAQSSGDVATAATDRKAQSPAPSNKDTSKDVSITEEADPLVEPTTKNATGAEAEDAEQTPVGGLPKTPS